MLDARPDIGIDLALLRRQREPRDQRNGQRKRSKWLDTHHWSERPEVSAREERDEGETLASRHTRGCWPRTGNSISPRIDDENDRNDQQTRFVKERVWTQSDRDSDSEGKLNRKTSAVRLGPTPREDKHRQQDQSDRSGE